MRQVVRRGFALVIAAALATGPASLVLAESPPPTGGPTVAGDDSFPATEDQDLDVTAPGLLANDNYGPDTCVASVDSSALAGVVVFHTDGSFRYTPSANFNGVTSFTYGIHAAGDEQCSGAAESFGVVTITVAPVNHAPTATADSFIVLKDRTLNVGAPGVLVNDHDVDADTLTAVLDSNVSHGTLVLALNGSFAYTPASGYTGPDAFSYHATDGALTNSDSPIRVVKLSVKAVPPTPVPTPTTEPTDTPEPTLEEPSPSPEVSPSIAPSPSAAPTASPSASPSVTPAPSPQPVPAAGQSGISLPVLLVILLFVLLLGFGAALYVPKWLAAQRGERLDDDDAS